MLKPRRCKVLVIGAGPGGYVAAIRAGQLGLDTVIVEAERTGGTCLIRGCIPSKALIHASEQFEQLQAHAEAGGHMGITLAGPPILDMERVVEWKDSIVDRLNKGVEMLLKKAGVEIIHGWAKFEDAKKCVVENSKGSKIIEAEHVILATGSVPTSVPTLPLGGAVISSREALDLDALPKRLIVIGGGYIGLEMGMAFAKLGSEVTILEALDNIISIFDAEIRRPIMRALKDQGIAIRTGVFATAVDLQPDGSAKVRVQPRDQPDLEELIPADKVLVTVGRRPRTQGWGLESMGLQLNEEGFLPVDKQCRTVMNKVWAIGDLTGEPMLAHRASAQGEMVAEIIAGERREFDPVAIPAVVFTDPEIVSVGLTPAEATNHGHTIEVGRFPFAASGRALTMDAGKGGGFVRVIADANDHRILGIQAVGRHVSELSGEFSLAVEMGALLEDIAGTIHAHPTLSEAFHESVLATLGHAIHVA